MKAKLKPLAGLVPDREGVGSNAAILPSCRRLVQICLDITSSARETESFVPRGGTGMAMPQGARSRCFAPTTMESCNSARQMGVSPSLPIKGSRSMTPRVAMSIERAPNASTRSPPRRLFAL